MMKNQDRTGRAEAKAKVSVYKKNSASFSLGLLAALLEAVYALQVLDQMQPGVMMGAVVAVNILLLFGIFTAAIKMNLYDKEWGCISIGISVFLVLRAAAFMTAFVKPMAKVPQLKIITLVCAGLLLAAGVICWIKHDRRQVYMNT